MSTEKILNEGINRVMQYGMETAVDAGVSVAKRKFDELADYVAPSTAPTKPIYHKGPEIITIVNKKYKRPLTKIHIKSKQKVKNSIDDLIKNDEYFGKSNTLMEESHMTPLKFIAGPKLYPDHFSHFMKQFQASGVSRTSWAGRILVPIGERRFHHQCFRHNLSADNTTSVSPAPYPNQFKKNILLPSNIEDYTPAVDIFGNPVAGAEVLPANTQPFRDMQNKQMYWAPDNRSDLEDMSWNANRFKPAPNANNTVATTLFADDVPTFASNAHSRASKLQLVNEVNADPNPGGSIRPAGWQWKACFNEGTISYNFMNKGQGPAKVELVLFKVKKTHLMSNRAIDYENDLEYPMNKSIAAISDGWVNSNNAIASTEAYDGRVPIADDVQTNPHFPFLPQLKRTRQRNVDFSEVGRQTFALTSGARRDVVFQLPGEVFNPVNIATMTPQDLNPFDQGTISPIMTEHTYVVTIAVQGCRSTLLLSNVPQGSIDSINSRLGDEFSSANIQFYCSYEEKVGPCMYQPPQNKILYNHGGIKKTINDGQAPGTFNPDVGTMLPQDRSIRCCTGNGTSTTAGVVN